MAKKKKSWEEIQKLANENGSKNQNTQNIMQSTRGTQPNIFSNMQPVQPKQVNLLEQNQRNMSTWDKVVNNMAYTGATFGNELGGGLINTAQMTNADTLNYAQRKGNQGVVKAATDFLSNYANPIQNGVPGFNLNDPVGSLKDILKTGERYNNIINSDAPFG